MLIYSKHGANVSFNLYEFYIKEATVRTAYMSPFSFWRSVNMLNKLNLESIITAEYDLVDAPKAFEEHIRGEHPRILIKFAE